MLTLINSFNVLRLDNFLLRTTKVVTNKINIRTGLNNFQVSTLCILLAIPALYIGSTSVDYIHGIHEFTSSQVLEAKSSLMIVMLFFVLLVSAFNWSNERFYSRHKFLLGSDSRLRYLWIFMSVFAILINIAVWYLFKEFSLMHYFFTILMIFFTMAMYFTFCDENCVVTEE